jgi:hypothetical protein
VTLPSSTAALPFTNHRTSKIASAQGRGIDLILIFAITFLALIALIVWLDNAEGITGNGIFKAVQAKPWIATPAAARLDPSNYLYFPFVGMFCRLLDLIDVFPGDPRRQITIINAFSAALCLCAVYIVVRKITHRRLVAWLAVLFQFACAFFLNLAISNEDIMPAYALLFASMALACVWFVEPTRWRVAVVAALFTIAWMFEWRLMFPTLPAMLFALGLGPGRVLQRLGRIVLFFGAMVATAWVTVALWGPQPNNVPSVLDLLWTGKGVVSGWAGFTWRKIGFLWMGMSEYLAGGRNTHEFDAIFLMWRELVIASAMILFLGSGALIILWRNRRSVDARVLAAVFGITFGAGEFLNLYSQPQDPQMQINVMAWLTIAWALVIACALRWRPAITFVTCLAFSAALLSYNLWQLLPLRGLDTAWRLSLDRIERSADPARTVFLLHGFEPTISKMFYHWDGQWNYFETLGPSPSPQTKFKILALVSGPVNKSKLAPKELADDLQQQIEKVMDLGYDVVASDIWNWDLAHVESSLSTVANKEKAEAIHQMLHSKFTGTPAFSDPLAGSFFRIQRASKENEK